MTKHNYPQIVFWSSPGRGDSFKKFQTIYLKVDKSDDQYVSVFGVLRFKVHIAARDTPTLPVEQRVEQSARKKKLL